MIFSYKTLLVFAFIVKNIIFFFIIVEPSPKEVFFVGQRFIVQWISSATFRVARLLRKLIPNIFSFG